MKETWGPINRNQAMLCGFPISISILTGLLEGRKSKFMYSKNLLLFQVIYIIVNNKGMPLLEAVGTNRIKRNAFQIVERPYYCKRGQSQVDLKDCGESNSVTPIWSQTPLSNLPQETLL